MEAEWIDDIDAVVDEMLQEPDERRILDDAPRLGKDY